MKKAITLLLSALLCVSLAGCTAPASGKNDKPDSGKKDEEITEELIMITPKEFTENARQNIEPFAPSLCTTEFMDHKYGTIEKVSYYSETCKRKRNVNVMLPADYDENKRYPVMYVLHGYWGNEDSMLDAGDPTLKIRQIVGNAVSDGEAKEMIVVFPYLYASSENDVLSGFNAETNAAYDNFINDLVNDLMPFIEEEYSVKTGRNSTAITGFSMGGRESIYIGLERPDLFGYVGAMCPAPGVDTDLMRSDEMLFEEGEEPYLFLITAGSADGVVGEVPAGYHAIFENNSVDHVWHYVSGGDHGGISIRAHMYNFVRYAFQAE